MAITNVPINPHALKKIIRMQGVKQEWLAMQVGVTTRTLRRWLSGNTLWLRLDNFEALIEALGTESRDTILVSDKLPLGTKKDQLSSANSLKDIDVTSLFYGNFRFDLAEKIIRASAHPDLDKKAQSKLLLDLAEACLRQGKVEQARNYGNQALDLCDSPQTRSTIIIRLSSIHLLAGDFELAINQLEEALDVSSRDKKELVAIYHNLAMAWLLEGSHEASLKYLELFFEEIKSAPDDQSFNFRRASGYSLYFDYLMELDPNSEQLEEAAKALEQSDHYWYRINNSYGQAQNAMKRCSLIAKTEGLEKLRNHYYKVKADLEALNPKPSSFTWLGAAMAFRNLGDLDLAKEILHGLEKEDGNWFNRGSLNEQLFHCYKDEDPKQAKSFLYESFEAWESGEAYSRLERLRKLC